MMSKCGYKHLVFCALALTSVLVFVLLQLPLRAFGAPTAGSTTNSGGFDIGTLSDRYDSLNKLENSLNEEQGVVIDTHVAVLVSVNRALDNSDVRFSGEVVGDVVNADDGYKWVNIMGTANNVIGVRMSNEQARLIQNVGSYHAAGTILQVTGTYHIACPEHQGELDVHALNIEVLDNGGPATHLISTRRLLIAISLCALSAILSLTFIILRRRTERLQDS